MVINTCDLRWTGVDIPTGVTIASRLQPQPPTHMNPRASSVQKNTLSAPKRPPFEVSSNWKRLQMRKTLTAGDLERVKQGDMARPVMSDAAWFDVDPTTLKRLGGERLALINDGPKVSVMGLFPPTPPGISASKLARGCKFVALDCEMVGVGGFGSAVGRVSVVNFHGAVLLDVYVRSGERVTDFRTAVSGLTPAHITPARHDPSTNMLGQPLVTREELQERLVPLLEGRVVVGHALNGDFSVLMLPQNPPRRMLRDTAQYRPFRALCEGGKPGLKMLAAHVLGVQIQEDAHDSVEDARIAMLLYRAVRHDWDGDKTKARDTKGIRGE